MIDYTKLHNALTEGGLIVDTITAGRLQRCKVQGDKGGKKSGAYRLFDDDLPLCLWWNWKTSALGAWVSDERPQTATDRARQREQVEQGRRERRVQQLAQWAENRQSLTRLWDGAKPLTDTCPAGVYLDRRGLLTPNTDALRHAPKLDYWDGGNLLGTFPAMLGAVTSPAGELVSIHRTYLDAEGFKAPVPTVKKLMATAGPMAGASIKIGQPAPRPDGRLGLGAAEGIETAIAAFILGGVPTWSCVSAHGLASFEPPADVHYLYVFGDRDDSGVGQKAASDLGHRAARSGLVARVLIPEAAGDWNDDLIARTQAV